MAGGAQRSWTIDGYRLRLGEILDVIVQRTTRASDGGPPRSYGGCPIAADRSSEDVLVPVGDDEAVWLGFDLGLAARAVAIRARIGPSGQIDGITGLPWDEALTDEPPNHLACPPECRLDGAFDGSGPALPFALPGGPGHGAIAAVTLVAIPGPPPAADSGAAFEPRLHAARRGEATDAGAGAKPRDGREGAARLDPGRWRLEEARSVTLRLVAPADFSRATGIPAPRPIDPRAAYRGERLP